jgi:serpin B
MRRILILTGALIVAVGLAVTLGLLPRAQRASADTVDPGRGRSGATADAGLLAAPLDRFGLDLLVREARADRGNVVISPVSVHDVLSMILNGARGGTAVEMRRTLGLGSLPLSVIDQSWADLIAEAQAGDEPAIQIANSLWLKSGVPFDQTFLDVNRDYFAAAPQALPADPVAAADAINHWTEERTGGLIERIVDPSYFDAQTIMALVNAVHLKTTWAAPFDVDRTAPAPFTLADGRVVQAPTMNGPLVAPVTRRAAYDAVALQTEGPVDVWVIVPKGSRKPEKLAATFADRGLAGVYGAAKPTAIMLALPRFKTTFSAPDLKAKLAAMGMPRAFSPDQAELQGIVAAGTPGRVYIQRVVHKAVLDVDESGIEAAAATAGIVGVTSMPLTPVTIRADRPFLMVVSLKGSGAPLFLALIRDPRS